MERNSTYISLRSEDPSRQVAISGAATGERIVDSARSLGNLITALPDIVYVLDEEGRFVFLNSSVEELGYTPEELLGRHFTELLLPEERDIVSREAVVARIHMLGDLPPNPPKLFDERRSGARMTRNLQVRLIRGNGGEPMYGSVNAYGEPISDPGLFKLFNCEGPVTVGIIHDITATVLYERGLEENLAAKALLLRELHHRVMDNLQVIASLAHLKQMGLDEKARSSLDGLSAQIRAIAMVHEILYMTENITDASVCEYFEKLAGLLTETFGRVGLPVSLEVDVDKALRLDADSLSYLALIASGFVSIAYRAGFPGDSGGKIKIGFSDSQEKFGLVLSEDGIDCSELYRAEPDYEIASALAAQLGGRLSLEGGKGTILRLSLPPFAL